MNKIRQHVNILIKKYNTSNVYELCDYLNITVKKDNLGSTKGYFLNIFKKYFIIINSNLEEWEECVVLAHELGHALLHRDTNICILKSYTYSITNKLENEANEFAAHLLITDDSLNDFKVYGDITIEDISKYFNVPKELVTYKL